MPFTFSPFIYGIIYIIRSPNHSDVYIGSTTQTIQARFREHMASWTNWIQSKSTKFVSVFDVLKRGDAYIEVLQHWPCVSRAELESREGYWQTRLTCVNARIMGRSKKESSAISYRKHRASRLARVHAYKLANAAKINAHNDCGCGGHYITKHAARHRGSHAHKAWILNQTVETLPPVTSSEASV